MRETQRDEDGGRPLVHAAFPLRTSHPSSAPLRSVSQATGSQATRSQITRSQITRSQATRSPVTKSQATGKQEPETLSTASNAAENPAAAQGRDARARRPGSAVYNPKKAGYDLGKLRAKGLVERIAHTHRYRVNPAGVRVITGALCLRRIILKPVLAGLWDPDAPPEPTPAMHPLDALTLGVQSALHKLLREAGLAP